ncbi:SAVED domain-containing protein [Lentzea sp. NPDC059081]|uniref:SAVED domain-containing protein n=1 Tax=Lentzea sp. NPDC059081 TaxID=3346719 RepID=UPI00367C300C
MSRRPSLLVSEAARDAMIAAAKRSHPWETGGILLGVLSEGRPWVTAVVEIPSEIRGPHHYELPGGATRPAVLSAREADHRLGYLGDWHSHPVDVGPSSTDLDSLRRNSSPHHEELNPTLVVVRSTRVGHVLDARRIIAGRPRSCDIQPTGGLPPAAPRHTSGEALPAHHVPSASGARIAGDDYQRLYAWRRCMEMLHESITGNSANPAVAVGVEEPGVGNGDDVVVHRTQPPNSYHQVKYAVDHRTAVGFDYLQASGVLRNIVQAYRDLTATGSPAEMRLVTNRTIDPGDKLMQDRDGRDGRLVPRASQGGPKSGRGKARAGWAAEAGVSEPELMDFLEHFHLDVAYDLDRLRSDVSLLMTANGLRSDAIAVNLGADWISRQVIAGRRRLARDDVRAAITDLGLERGSPWTTVSISTIKHDAVAHQASVAVDWVDRMSGDTDWSRVAPEPPNTWEDLATEVRSVPARLGDANRVLVSGHLRQATGFLIGSELRRVMGYEVGIRQGDQLWTSSDEPEKYDVTVDETTVGGDTGTAIIVNVATDAAGQALRWITDSGLEVQTAVTVSPSRGTGPSSVPTPRAANGLAIAVRDIARRHSSTGPLHLFLIGPLGLAVLLGHHWNRVTTTYVYEHLAGSEYTRAFVVSA